MNLQAKKYTLGQVWVPDNNSGSLSSNTVTHLSVTVKKLKGPFILRCNCVALPQCTLLHRNCDVTALWCRMKVNFILTWNAVKLWWLAAESNQYISTATQLRCSMNEPLKYQHGSASHFARVCLCHWLQRNNSIISLIVWQAQTMKYIFG